MDCDSPTPTGAAMASAVDKWLAARPQTAAMAGHLSHSSQRKLQLLRYTFGGTSGADSFKRDLRRSRTISSGGSKRKSAINAMTIVRPTKTPSVWLVESPDAPKTKNPNAKIAVVISARQKMA